MKTLMAQGLGSIPKDYSANDLSWYTKFLEIFDDTNAAGLLVSAMRALEALGDKNAATYFPNRVGDIELLKTELARLVQAMFAAKENPDQQKNISVTLASLQKALLGLKIPAHIVLPNRHHIATQMDQTQVSSSRLAG